MFAIALATLSARAAHGQDSPGDAPSDAANGGDSHSEAGPDEERAQPRQVDLRDEAASQAFDSGMRLYAAGDFDAAAEAFEHAYELSRRPEMLFNQYLAHRDAGRFGEAADALEAYLAVEPNAEQRSLLEARLGSLREQQASAEPADRSRDGTHSDGSNDSTPDRGANASSATAPSGPDFTGPIVLFAIGGLTGAGAAVTGGLALTAQSDLESACPTRRDCDPSLIETRDRAETLSLVTDILWPTAAAIGVAALVWLIVEVSGDDGAETTAAQTFERQVARW